MFSRISAASANSGELAEFLSILKSLSSGIDSLRCMAHNALIAPLVVLVIVILFRGHAVTSACLHDDVRFAISALQMGTSAKTIESLWQSQTIEVQNKRLRSNVYDGWPDLVCKVRWIESSET